VGAGLPAKKLTLCQANTGITLLGINAPGCCITSPAKPICESIAALIPRWFYPEDPTTGLINVSRLFPCQTISIRNPSINLFAMNRYRFWRRDSQPDLIAVYRDDCHQYVVSQIDTFTGHSSED
jgi:hypothetical protein